MSKNTNIPKDVIDLTTDSPNSSPTLLPTQPPPDPIKCPFGCINNFESSEALLRHIDRLHPETGGKKKKSISTKRNGTNGKVKNRKEEEGCCVF